MKSANFAFFNQSSLWTFAFSGDILRSSVFYGSAEVLPECITLCSAFSSS